MRTRPSPDISLPMLSLALYVISLIAPAMTRIDRPLFGGAGDDKMLLGIDCLLLGWIVVVPWLANPLLLFAAIAYRIGRREAAAWFAVAAILFALTTFWFVGRDFHYPNFGFYVWIASMYMLFIASVRRKSANPKRADL